MMTPKEVADITFAKSMVGGYQMSAVDAFLDRLTEDYYDLYKQNTALQTKVQLLTDKLTEYREVEDTMRSTLLTAQRMANEIVQEAERKRNAAFEDANRSVFLRRQELESEIEQQELRLTQVRQKIDLQVRREEERLAKVRQELRDYIGAVRAVCQKQLAFLDALPIDDTDPERPEMAEAKEAAAREETAEPSPSPTADAAPVDTVAMLEDIFATVDGCVTEGDSAAEGDRRANLDELPFHSEYTKQGE